jgi:hypothetical protein
MSPRSLGSKTKPVSALFLSGFWWERQKKRERDHWEDIDVGGKIMLKWILGKYDGVVWTGFIWLRIENLQVP